MNELISNDMDEIIKVQEAEEREKRVLSMLLEKQRTKSNHHLVIQARMGEVPSYVTSVTLRWVAQHVGFAADLPLFHQSDKASKTIPVNQETIELLQQRRPDWQRQLQLSAYLATRRKHKFPPLLLVGYQEWIYNERSEKWGVDKCAMYESLNVRALDLSGLYCGLDVSNTNFYALDGQHRLMGILGLRDLISQGHLHALDKKRVPKKAGGLSRDEVIERIHLETGEDKASVHERLQGLMDEHIGIEIVPAVVAGESRDEAFLRLRQLFVDVNENAKRLTVSQLAQLDESNGFRVVARRIMVEHHLFSGSASANGGESPRVDTENVTLTENSDSFTTLKALVEIVKRYLTENKRLAANKRFISWNSFVAKGISIRPEDSLLEEAKEAMCEYFDALTGITSHQALVEGTPAGQIRCEEGGDNILFRPVAQMALADAIGKLMTAGLSLESIVHVLSKEETKGSLRLRDKNSPWFGVLCDPASGTMRRQIRHERLCSRLFQYLLGDDKLDEKMEEKLRSDFAQERKVDDKQAFDSDGKIVEIGNVRLPSPWR